MVDMNLNEKASKMNKYSYNLWTTNLIFCEYTNVITKFLSVYSSQTKTYTMQVE